MLIDFFIVTCIVLALMTFLCLYRAYVGPTAADRVVAINVIGTKTVVMISLVSYIYSSQFFFRCSFSLRNDKLYHYYWYRQVLGKRCARVARRSRICL